ncbi:putative RDH13, partial [Operophtera brumata]
KFCVVLFTRELAKRLRGENVVVNSVNPGAVGTRIFDGWHGLFGRVVTWFFFCFFKTPWQGAQTALHVALDETAGDVSGEYFENCCQSRAISRAYNDKLANEVWEASLR